MSREWPLSFAIGPLSVALFLGCTDTGDRLEASLVDTERGGTGGSPAGVGGAMAGRGQGGDSDDAGMGGDGASSARGGSDNGEGGSRPSRGGSQGVGAGGKGARGGSGGGDAAGESGNDAAGGVPASGRAGAGGVGTGTGGVTSGGVGGIGAGGDGGDGGDGGETALPDQLDLCIRLTDTSQLAFELSLLYEAAVIQDCHVNWVTRLYYDTTIGLNDRSEFLNHLVHFNLRLWGCPSSAPPNRFDLIYEPTPLSEADAAALIDAYVGSASNLLTLSPGEEDEMQGLLERLSTKVLAEPDPGGYSEDRCGIGGSGAGGAGAGGGSGEGGADPGGAAGQAGAG